MLEKLTVKQRETFTKLVSYIEENEAPPSIRTLRDLINIDISHIAILYRLLALVKKKYLRREDGKFIPTSEGIKQYIVDTDIKARIKTIRI